MTGIISYGGYIPRLRLNRKAMASANAWMEPSLFAYSKGERSMCNWDEDSVTMAVEAARDCLTGLDKNKVDAIYAASTSFPFSDRQNSGIIAGALNLSENIAGMDVTSSQRAATSGLIAALNAATAEGGQHLLVAGEKRETQSAVSQELLYGDGAAALMLGSENVIAEYLGSASVTVDFVDHYRRKDKTFDYNWEERWIRDEGLTKIPPQAIKRALEKTGVSADQITHFIMPSVFGAAAPKIAKLTGISAEAIRDNLFLSCGEAGVAHSMIMLVDALQDAKAGDVILVAAFGQGCDALLFKVTDAINGLADRNGVKGSLARRKEESNYMKFLTFNGLINQGKGLRAESNPQTALTTLYRNRKMLAGLVGGVCSKCQTQQFPKAAICVNPSCKHRGDQADVEFADQSAKIMSWSNDALTYTIDPPAHYGMVQFDDGGRFFADFTDYDVGNVDVGMPVRMVFRIKDTDDIRGMNRYFWKAAPIYTAGEEA